MPACMGSRSPAAPARTVPLWWFVTANIVYFPGFMLILYITLSELFFAPFEPDWKPTDVSLSPSLDFQLIVAFI